MNNTKKFIHFREVYIEARALRDLVNPDCTSVQAYIARYGGNVNGEKAVKCKISWEDPHEHS